MDKKISAFIEAGRGTTDAESLFQKRRKIFANNEEAIIALYREYELMTVQEMDKKMYDFMEANWGTADAESLYRRRCEIFAHDVEAIIALYKEYELQF